MSKKRESLVGDGDTIDLSEIAECNSAAQASQYDTHALRQASEQAGFPSREPHPATQKRRRRKRSPYTEQLNFKVRVGFKELLQDVADDLKMTDAETLEQALHALLEKQAMHDRLKLLAKLTGP